MSTRERNWWIVAGIAIVIYALFPIVWIVSLSIKRPRHLQRPVPAHRATWENYALILTGGRQRAVPAGAAQLLRHLPDRHRPVLPAGDVRRLRHRPAGLPGKRLILSTALAWRSSR
jgi:multiple sugar transport system permease protein